MVGDKAAFGMLAVRVVWIFSDTFLLCKCVLYTFLC